MPIIHRFRRRWLKTAATLGLLGPAGIAALVQDVLAAGDLPKTSGIHSLEGEVTVNGQSAKVGTLVKPGDRIATGPRSMAVVVVGKDAYLLRERSSVTIQANQDRPDTVDALLIVAGKVLSVFAKRASAESSLRVKVPNATIGIRGTGMYVEIHEGRTYFCLCYGQAAIEGAGMREAKIVTTTHHESPLWLDDRSGTMAVEKGPFLNHSDDELIMLEKLTGREPPFVAQGLTGRY